MNTQRIVTPFGAQSTVAEVFKGIDLRGKRASTWRRPATSQTQLATHFTGQPLTVDHGAPLRLLVPVKLGLKNVKTIYQDYVCRGRAKRLVGRTYSRYDGI